MSNFLDHLNQTAIRPIETIEQIQENLSHQIDGTKYCFCTESPYIRGSLLVFYNGIAYIRDHDFEETGEREFTFVAGRPFPPRLKCLLYVIYRKKIIND